MNVNQAMTLVETAITEADKRYVWAIGCLAKAVEVAS